MITEDSGEEEFDKAVGQLRLAIGEVMQPLRAYGQDYYVNGATEELVSLAIQLHYRLSGLDIPYYVNPQIA